MIDVTNGTILAKGYAVFVPDKDSAIDNFVSLAKLLNMETKDLASMVIKKDSAICWVIDAVDVSQSMASPHDANG